MNSLAASGASQWHQVLKSPAPRRGRGLLVGGVVMAWLCWAAVYHSAV